MNIEKNDGAKAAEFAAMINQHASFTMNVTQIIKFSRLLVWYNDLPKKLDDNVFEVVRINNPPEASADTSTEPAKE